MKFNFMSICTYSCGVCPMYCCLSNSLVPMILGTILFVNVVLGTLEMHWRIVLFTTKVLSPRAFWSQARTINEVLSTTSFPCYLVNKYLPHAYISCIQPCVGCIMAWHSWYLFPFAKHPNYISSVRLFLVVMSLMFVCLEVINIQWDNIISRTMCSRKDLIGILMTSIWLSCSLLL